MKPHTLALPLLLLAGMALAQQVNLLSLSLQQSLVQAANGKAQERLVSSPKSVLPGDVLSQVVTAQNRGERTLKDVHVSLPVPKGTQYISPESTLNVYPVQFSIDGGKTFAPAPLKRKVTVNENGKATVKEVVVKPSEYNAVRWIIPEVAAGKSQRVGFRVKVQ